MAKKERAIRYSCPHCGEPITRRPEAHTDYRCPRCSVRYRVLWDEQAQAAALVDQSGEPSPEPLGLPKGSVRAVIALAMAAACGVLVFRGHDVPSSLGSLVLTIVGFYFGFRTKAAGMSDRVYDPAARREQPLHLPAGVIRNLLVLGFLAMGALLALRGRLLGVLAHVELFFILAGLIVGHYFGKAFAGTSYATRAALAHVKGLAGLAMAAVLVGVFVSGRHLALPPYVVMLLCAAISFYFGSRT